MSPDGKAAILSFLEHPITWLIGAGGTGGIIGALSERRKKNAESDATAVGSSLSIVKELREQLAMAIKKGDKNERRYYKLTEIMFKLRADNFTLRNYIATMTRRDGDPAVPHLLMDDEKGSWEIDDDDDDSSEREVKS